MKLIVKHDENIDNKEYQTKSYFSSFSCKTLACFLICSKIEMFENIIQIESSTTKTAIP